MENCITLLPWWNKVWQMGRVKPLNPLVDNAMRDMKRGRRVLSWSFSTRPSLMVLRMKTTLKKKKENHRIRPYQHRQRWWQSHEWASYHLSRLGTLPSPPWQMGDGKFLKRDLNLISHHGAWGKGWAIHKTKGEENERRGKVILIQGKQEMGSIPLPPSLHYVPPQEPMGLGEIVIWGPHPIHIGDEIIREIMEERRKQLSLSI